MLPVKYWAVERKQKGRKGELRSACVLQEPDISVGMFLEWGDAWRRRGRKSNPCRRKSQCKTQSPQRAWLASGTVSRPTGASRESNGVKEEMGTDMRVNVEVLWSHQHGEAPSLLFTTFHNRIPNSCFLTGGHLWSSRLPPPPPRRPPAHYWTSIVSSFPTRSPASTCCGLCLQSVTLQGRRADGRKQVPRQPISADRVRCWVTALNSHLFWVCEGTRVLLPSRATGMVAFGSWATSLGWSNAW